VVVVPLGSIQLYQRLSVHLVLLVFTPRHHLLQAALNALPDPTVARQGFQSSQGHVRQVNTRLLQRQFVRPVQSALSLQRLACPPVRRAQLGPTVAQRGFQQSRSHVRQANIRLRRPLFARLVLRVPTLLRRHPAALAVHKVLSLQRRDRVHAQSVLLVLTVRRRVCLLSLEIAFQESIQLLLQVCVRPVLLVPSLPRREQPRPAIHARPVFMLQLLG